MKSHIPEYGKRPRHIVSTHLKTLKVSEWVSKKVGVEKSLSMGRGGKGPFETFP